MKLPPDATVALEKAANYLLRFLDENDKSRFLACAGYALNDPDRLIRDIREQLLPLNAEFIALTEYGTKYRIRGALRGPNGRTLRVISVWMTVEATGRTQVVTRYPDHP